MPLCRRQSCGFTTTGVMVVDSLLCTRNDIHVPHSWRSLVTGASYQCGGDPEAVLEPLSFVRTRPRRVPLRVPRLRVPGGRAGALAPCAECGQIQLTIRGGLVRAHPPRGERCAGSRLPPQEAVG